MDYLDWERLLSERFPSRDDIAYEHDWVTLKKQLSVGQSVSGIVFAKAPFGAFLDIGIGFPALLEIIYIAGLTPERYQAGDWCPIGSEITAVVGGFSDWGHQVRLWQVSLKEQRDAELSDQSRTLH